MSNFRHTTAQSDQIRPVFSNGIRVNGFPRYRLYKDKDVLFDTITYLNVKPNFRGLVRLKTTGGVVRYRNYRKLQTEHGIDISLFGDNKREDRAGFYWNKRASKYVAYVCEDGVSRYIGRFDSALDARAAHLIEMNKKLERNNGRDRNETKNR